jgi:hypothetical protein
MDMAIWQEAVQGAPVETAGALTDTIDGMVNAGYRPTRRAGGAAAAGAGQVAPAAANANASGRPLFLPSMDDDFDAEWEMEQLRRQRDQGGDSQAAKRAARLRNMAVSYTVTHLPGQGRPVIRDANLNANT